MPSSAASWARERPGLRFTSHRSVACRAVMPSCSVSLRNSRASRSKTGRRSAATASVLRVTSLIINVMNYTSDTRSDDSEAQPFRDGVRSGFALTGCVRRSRSCSRSSVRPWLATPRVGVCSDARFAALLGVPVAFAAVLFQTLIHDVIHLVWDVIPDEFGWSEPSWWYVVLRTWPGGAARCRRRSAARPRGTLSAGRSRGGPDPADRTHQHPSRRARDAGARARPRPRSPSDRARARSRRPGGQADSHGGNGSAAPGSRRCFLRRSPRSSGDRWSRHFSSSR